MAQAIFTYTGADQTFTVPADVYSLTIKAWGAGGGGTNGTTGQGNGGAGGYTTGLLSVIPGDVLTIVTGGAGRIKSIVATYGGGGAGGNDTSSGNFDGGSGGGRSAVIRGGVEILTAGGGGGAGGATALIWSNGGAGGGTSGTDAFINQTCLLLKVGGGGSQTAGGVGGTGAAAKNNGVAGVQFHGGAGGPCTVVNCGAGGGGGSGYFGGGGGASQAGTGTVICNLNMAQEAAGGGGSGYFDPTVIAFGSTLASPQNTATARIQALPPNTTDVDYTVGIGVGGSAGSNGGNGLVVLDYIPTTVTVTKQVDPGYAAVGDTLNYQVVMTSVALPTLTNVLFIDTIPTATAFVPNSLTVNGIALAGSPQPPGINIGTVPQGDGVVTIEYSVQVTTIPTPNSIINTGSITSDNSIGGSSNDALTTINMARLATHKTTSEAYAIVGDTIMYTIGIINSGNVTANNVVFSDTIPNGTTFVPNSLMVNGIAQLGNPSPPGIAIGSIPVLATYTITFSVVVNTIPVPNPIPNSGTSSYSYTKDPRLSDVTAATHTNTVTTQINQANVGVTKKVNQNTSGIGDTLTYTLTFINTGSTTANHVILTDTIATAVSFVPGSLSVNGVPNVGSPVAGVDIGSIGPDAVTTVTFQVVVTTFPTTNPIPNTAGLGYNYTVDPSFPNTKSNTGVSNTVTTKVVIARIDYASGGLTKAVDQPYADVGDTVTYTIGVKNTGNTTAVSVVFTDTIPKDTTFVPGSVTVNGLATSDNPQTGGIKVGNVGPSQTVTLTFKVLVNTIPNPNPILNAGTVNFTFVTDPSVPTSAVGIGNSNTVATTVNHAVITTNDVVKSVSQTGAVVGDILTYSVGVTNTGNTTATNVMFSDTMPNGTTFVGGSITVNGTPTVGNPLTGVPMGNIPAGGTSTISFQVVVNTVPTPNPMPNQGIVAYTYTIDPIIGTIGVGQANSNSVDTFVANVTLNMNKSVDKANAGVGDTVVYTIALNNTGNTTANHIMLVDTVPNGMAFVPGSVVVNGISRADTPQSGISVGNIGAGQMSTVTFSMTIQTIPNPNPARNTADSSFTFTGDPTKPDGQTGVSQSNTVATKVNAISIDNGTGTLFKTVDYAYADVGYTLTYTIVMTNNGNTTANNVVLTDTIPVNTTFVAGSAKVNGVPSTEDPGAGGITVGDLGVAQRATITFQVVAYTIPNPNPIPNNGTVRFSYITDPSVPTRATGVGNTNTVVTTVNHASIINAKLLKTVNQTGAVVGDLLSYTIAMTNTGNITATQVVFRDTIPNGTTYVIGSVTVNGAGAVGTPSTGVNVGDIAAGGTSVLSFQVVIVTLPNPNPIPNQGSVNYTYTINQTTGGQGSGGAVSNVVTTFVAEGIITTTKRVDKANAGVGDTVVYTVVMQNSGNATVDNIILSDTVPNGMRFVSHSVTINGVPTIQDPEFGIQVGTLVVGQVSTVTFSVVIDTLPNPNPVMNTANSRFTYTANPANPEGQSGESTSNTVSTHVNYAIIDDQAGSLTKTVDKLYADVDDTLTYTLVLVNTGNTTANTIVVTDTIPTDTSFVAGSVTVNGLATADHPQSGGIPVGALGVNEHATITFQVVVSTVPRPNPLANSGTVHFTYVTDPSVPTSAPGVGNSNTVLTTVNHASIMGKDFVKSVDRTGAVVGDVLTYITRMTNSGNTTATNVTFSDVIPNDTSFVQGSLTVNGSSVAGSPSSGVTIGTIPPSGTSSVSFKVVVNTIPTPNPIPNQGQIQYTYVINPTTSKLGIAQGVTNTVETLVGYLTINSSKYVDKANAGIGDTLVYTIALQNQGNTTANHVVLRDTIPNGTSFVSGSVVINGMPSSGNPQNGLPLGDLGMGQVATISFSVTVDTLPNPNPIPNTSDVTFDYTVDPSSPDRQSGKGSSNTVTTYINQANIDYGAGGLVKSVDKPYADVGDTLTYTFKVRNTGNTAAHNTLLRDTIPTATSFVAGSVTVDGVPRIDNPQTGGIAIGDLGINQTVIVTFRVTVTTVPSPNPIRNEGTVSFSYMTDPSVPTSQLGRGISNTVVTTVNRASITSGDILKTVDKLGATVGDTLTYTISVTNTGNIAATNVTLHDTVPNGTTFVPGSIKINGSPGTGNPTTGIVMGTIAVGDTSQASFDVVVQTLPTPNPIPNQGVITYTYVINADTGTTGTGQVASNTVTTLISYTTLTMLKSVDKAQAGVGDSLVYTISLNNTGNATLTHVLFTDTMPSGTSFIYGSLMINGRIDFRNPEDGITLEDIGIGQVTILNFSVTVDTLPMPNPILNKSSATFSYTADPNFPDGQSGGSSSNTVATQINQVIINPETGGLMKAVDKAYADVGSTLTYTVNVKNTGSLTVHQVVVTDTIPPFTQFIPGSATVNGVPSSADPEIGGISVGDLGVNQTAKVAFQVRVLTLPSPNPIPNEAVLSYTYVTDPSIPASQTGAGISNTVVTTINQANLATGSIVKSVDKTGAAVGNTLIYAIGISNTGNTVAENVILTDTVPHGTTWVQGSIRINGSAGTGNPSTGIPVGSIGSGSTSTVSFEVVIDTLPIPNPIPNQGTIHYTYIIDPNTGKTGTGRGASNIVETLISYVTVKSLKSVNKANAGIGDTLVYTITLQNVGNTTVNHVTVKDTIPNGTKFIPGSVVIDGVPLNRNPAVELDIGSLGINQVTTINFSVLVFTMPSPNPIPNTSGVSFTYTANPSQPDGQSGSGGSNTVTTLINRASIDNSTGGLTKAVDQSSVAIGAALTYTFMIKNTGNTTAQSVVLTDTIPTGTTFVPGSVTIDGVPSPSNPEVGGITVGDLGPNQTSVITFKVMVSGIDTPETILNTGTVTFSYMTDPSIVQSQNGSGNSNTVVTAVNRAIINDENIIKSVDKAGAGLGDILTYTVGITNVGNIGAVQVVFTDTIPNGTRFLFGSVTLNGTSIGGNPNQGIPIGTIGAKQTSTVTFKVLITTLPNPNPIPNQARIDYNYAVSPTLPIYESGSGLSNVALTYINKASIDNSDGGFIKTVDKDYANVGDTLTYNLMLQNTGSVAATHIIVTDTIPKDTSFVPGSVIINGVSSSANPQTGIATDGLAPQAMINITFQVVVMTLPMMNPIPNDATVNFKYTMNQNRPDGAEGGGNTNTVVTQINYPKVITQKFCNKVVSTPGDTLTYTINIVNTGNIPVDHVVIYDTVPEGTVFVINSSTVYGVPTSDAPDTGINVGIIGVGRTATVTFDVVVSNTVPGSNTIVNEAQTVFMATIDPSVPDGYTSSNLSNRVVTAIKQADLSQMTKSVDDAYASCGEQLIYTIRIPNTGNVDALGVVVTDSPPNGTVFVIGSVTVNGVSMPEANPALGIPVGDIATGETTVITYEVEVIC